jgi:hypothetical protein
MTAVTADPWAKERAAYIHRIVDEAEVEWLVLVVEDLERRFGMGLAGRRYARLLGLPPELAEVAGVMILSPSRAARLRAGDLIVRALLRAARRAA